MSFKVVFFSSILALMAILCSGATILANLVEVHPRNIGLGVDVV